MAIEREIRLGAQGGVLEQIEVFRDGAEVKRRVLVPDGRGVPRVVEERVAAPVEVTKLLATEDQEAFDQAKQERLTIIARKAQSDPDFVTIRVVEGSITVAEARAAGWTPPTRGEV